MKIKSPYADKNLLILTSIQGNVYLEYLYSHLEPYFRGVTRLNFTEHLREHGLGKTEAYIRDFISGNKIDLVLVFIFPTDFELTPQYFNSLRKPAKLAFWFFDDDTFFDVTSKYVAQAADAVITTDYYPSVDYQKLEIPVVYHTPMNDTAVYHPVKVPKDIDVCFIGDCTKANRMEFIGHLTSGGIKVETFGHGSKNGFLPEDKIAEVYSRSKIVLNFTKVEKSSWLTKDEPLLNRVRQSKGHFSQVELAGAFCLSEYAPELKITAEIGRELDVFNNKEELLQKTRYYLAHDKEREAIAATAYKKAISAFTAENVLDKIITDLHEVLSGERANINPYAGQIFLSRAFKRKYVNGLTFTFFILLSSGKVLNAAGVFARLFRFGILPFLSGFPAGALRSAAVLIHKLTGKYSEIYKQ